MFAKNLSPLPRPLPRSGEGRWGEGDGAIWMDYADLEMSIIPIPQGWKRPDYKWRRLKWTKLHILMDSMKGQRFYERLFDLGGDGLAVVCGRPSENLFVIDCDTAAALMDCRRQLLARGIAAPCVRSSRGGHLYLRAREGAVKTVPAGVIPDIEIRGDGALVVLPPTLHSSGIRYAWEGGLPHHIPTVSVHEIDFLMDSDSQRVNLNVGLGERRLHDDTRDYLRRGGYLPEGVRNSRLFDAARDYKYVGRDSGDALHDLLPRAIQSGLDADEATASILSAYGNASPRGDAPVSQTQQLEAFVAHVQWEGRTGKTDKRVFEALIQRRRADAPQRGDGIFRASYRELMELARYNAWRTIARSLKRLIKRGYIDAMGHDSESRACLFRMTRLVLGAGEFFLMQRVHTNTAVSGVAYCGHFAQLAESNGFGATGAAILRLLRDLTPGPSPYMERGSWSSLEIAERLGCHRTTVTRHLRNLIDQGLVEAENYRYRAVDISPNRERQIVVQTGAYRQDAERKRRFDLERAVFALGPILEFLWTRTPSVAGATSPPQAGEKGRRD